MAHKRMFSRDIVQSDAFLDMPSSTQALYFHLGMEADDDGFVGNPKRVIRAIGTSDDDLKLLIGKKFVLIFISGVLVVKHHRINNNWDKHNCKRTMYIDEFSQLSIKENRAYTLDETQGVPVQSDSRLKTVFRIEENRREEKRIHTPAKADVSVYSDDFLSFWAAYSRKVGKGAAWASWKKAKRPPLVEILKSVELHKGSRQWQRDNGQFIPHPATWLNQRRWEDEVQQEPLPERVKHYG